MIVLVVNAGSSSLKYQLFDTEKNYEMLAKGLCDCIGLKEGGRIKHEAGQTKYETEVFIPDHAFAVELVVKALTDPAHGVIKDMSEIDAVGHRIVQGGPYFSDSVLVTDAVMEDLSKCVPFAPLHTNAHIQGIKGITAVLKNVPQVLVIDTGFHCSMPEVAKTYALPRKVAKTLAVRRYGAHGTSHRYVSGEMCRILGRVEGTKIVTCHLGNGSSISAVKDGKCFDTSMGLTPLAGIIMGSRTGDMDPAIVPFIIQNYEKIPYEDRPEKFKTLSVDNVNDFMNKACGLLGVSGVSSDMRAVIAEIETNAHGCADDAKLAYDILVYGIKKYIGAYAAAMNGCDAIVFTAGIGENNAAIRRDVCRDMDYLGVKLDEKVNATARGKVTKLSAPDSKVEVYLIPTNEELMIAKDTEEIVRKPGA
ncbi:MAG: acetate kinase [Clostridia bacterium]|nr:acetate kinase [Clostridia bacterium]